MLVLVTGENIGSEQSTQHVPGFGGPVSNTFLGCFPSGTASWSFSFWVKVGPTHGRPVDHPPEMIFLKLIFDDRSTEKAKSRNGNSLKIGEVGQTRKSKERQLCCRFFCQKLLKSSLKMIGCQALDICRVVECCPFATSQ